MNRESVLRTIDRVGIRVARSVVHGPSIRRSGYVSQCPFDSSTPYRRVSFQGIWYEEEWRLECGSGVAGRSGEWTLVLMGGPRKGSLGPVGTVRDLERLLRQWRRWEAP